MASSTINKNMKTDDENSTVTDVIGIIDRSGSMASMGMEPVQALNAFLEEQKSNADDDTAVVTLIAFNNDTTTIVDHQPIGEVKAIAEKDYIPSGGTALNDAVCSTIVKELASENPRNKVVVVITDGQENGSQTYSTSDTRSKIADAENNYGWKFIFLGANIDAFATGATINISQERCAQFDASVPGELLGLARQASTNVNEYRRARSDGHYGHKLSVDTPDKAVTCPSHARHRSVLQSPMPNMTLASNVYPPFPLPLCNL